MELHIVFKGNAQEFQVGILLYLSEIDETENAPVFLYFLLAIQFSTGKTLNEFHAHVCDNNRQISKFAGERLAGLTFGFYRVLNGRTTQDCLQQCCLSVWCDFVLVSDGKCYGIQCSDQTRCRSQERTSKYEIGEEKETDFGM